METITATFKVVTPMFMSGADNRNSAELRLSSIKGALQFWWRALAWERHKGNLQKVRAEEATIFGSTNSQASILMKLPSNNIPDSTETIEGIGRLNGAIYLGYGVINHNGILQRPCLPANFTLSLQCALKKTALKHKESIRDAFICLGLFGGVGAKSRKGYGSIILEKLISINHKTKQEGDLWSKSSNVNELKKSISEFLSGLNFQANTLPKYTAFSKKSRVDIVSVGKNPIRLLDEVGKALQIYRSYGQNINRVHVVNGEESWKVFEDDHDNMRAVANGQRAPRHPERVAFGLPHNYYFHNLGRVNVEPASQNLNRRASPLFIHIHGLSNERYAAVLSLLPAQFLPEGENIKVSSGRNILRLDQEHEELNQYSVIRTFLDQDHPKAHRKYFPNSSRVFP